MRPVAPPAKKEKKRPSSAPGITSSHASGGNPKNAFESDPHWRCVKEKSAAEKSNLEAGWDSQHGSTFHNPPVNPLLRDYFDRPRERDVAKAGNYELRRGGKYHAWWRLEFGPTFQINEGGWFNEGGRGDGRPSSASVPRKNWNDRHQLTVSRSNPVYCNAQKEYFGRYVEPERDTTIPTPVLGITKHYWPHRSRASADGCDKSIVGTTRVLAEYAFANAKVKSILPPEEEDFAAERPKHDSLPLVDASPMKSSLKRQPQPSVSGTATSGPQTQWEAHRLPVDPPHSFDDVGKCKKVVKARA